MSRRLPPLNALKAFEAAARHMSFTRAAEELFVTQAAISHQIKGLEEFLGLKLFRRKNRTLFLTEEGQAYFQDIRDVFTSLVEATDRLLARTAKGALTVSMMPSFAIQWLVPRLTEFSERNPEIDVRIKAVNSEEDSLTDDVDVAIYYGHGHWRGLRVDKLLTEYQLPLCSPARLKGPRPLNKPEDLKYHVLLHDATRQPWKDWLNMVGVKDVNADQGPIFSHTTLVLQAAIHGQGVALGHSVLAQPEIAAGRLVCPFPERLISEDAYYLVSDEHQADLGKIAAFREWILARAAREQQEMNEAVKGGIDV